MTSESPERLTYEEVAERLTAEGAPFETVEEEVLGQRIQLYKNRARSLRELLAGSSAHGDKTYFIFDDGRRVTYAEHLRIVASVARALSEDHGVQQGDRVAILAANCPEWIVAYWASVSLGAIVVGMNGWWTGDEIQYGLRVSKPKLLIADQRRLARLDGADPGVPTVVVETDFDALWNRDLDAELPDVPIAEDDPSVILFTSGTTGRPKAAMLSHRNLCAFVMSTFFIGARRAMTEPTDSRPGGAGLAVFPLFHVSGMFGSTTTGLAAGTTSVWPTGRFDAKKVIELTKQHGITTWGGAATHVFRLLDAVDEMGFDTSVLTSVGIGGSATTPELIRRSEERIPQTRGTFGSGYGSTETGALVSYANHAMLIESPDCVGPPLPTVELRILDEDDNDVGEGVDGQICVRSPMVMLGYWENDDANAETLLPERWLKIGDVGRLQRGRLHLAARKRDLIIRGGENIYPVEIENRLEAHPDLLEVAVVGVDHVELGQEAKAIVVPREGANPDPEELKAFVAEKLAYFKVPAYIEVRRDKLPRNATGKVMKHVLTGDADNKFVEE
ncbi:MAG: class I adenylate-forming enzyme family protein [Myxococcota bacterium]|nr:class I adenylate-forming enzyme family protein [Myxococcota bacterium]